VRVGIGYDLHPLKPGRDLILGGVRIEHPAGLDGHSDADVLTHAVIDALLGAAGLGDIGKMFPADDPSLKGASSLDLLDQVVEALGSRGYTVVNVDSTVIAQAPRLGPHLDAMRQNISARLQVGPEKVAVKATSPEGVGALGHEVAIAAQAIALIESR
jgi:2-C-methyl-D-erythritol 2,4-cyclodiphosphate synthase